MMRNACATSSSSCDATEHMFTPASRDATERTFTQKLLMTFLNIDWKKARHDTPASTQRNLDTLYNTIHSVVRIHNPSVLCMCEVGCVDAHLTPMMMQSVAETCMTAWRNVCRHATERPDLKAEYEVGAAYLTIWDRRQTTCFGF